MATCSGWPSKPPGNSFWTDRCKTDWVVYAKTPFGGPEQVLKYLARYTHRVAISNQRLLSLENGMVTFRWKDYAHGSRQSTMTLTATEFIRRFLLHVLPTSFVRIRYYGFLANRHRVENLARCRELLGEFPSTKAQPVLQPAEPIDAPSPEKSTVRRPRCQDGYMWIIEELMPQHFVVARRVPYRDTS